VNDLFVEQVVQVFEVGDFQGSHGLDGQTERLIGGARLPVPAQVSPRRPQGAKHLCPTESLPFTVLAEAHGSTLLSTSGSPVTTIADV
jgi:hypothetical protein